MSITYAQKNKNAVQTKRESSVSIIDSSSQSESLQRKADMANNAAQRAEAPRPNNTGMPDNLKSGIESLSGFSMDDVRVHYNSSKPATVQALAYTQGTDIHVAPGQEKHLPHEAWHVAQQMAGRVSPTTNINGMPVNDNAALEHEADVMGEKAVQCKMFGANFTNGYVQSLAVQRMAYAKINRDGTVSTETEQDEGNAELVDLFGREKKGDKYIRPENVARKVDQYKKEMLTYIACRIEDRGEAGRYGPHISVVITRGIWFIAINSDCVSPLKIKELKENALEVQTEIFQKWKSMYSNREHLGLKSEDPKNVRDDIVKRQALYITYRWAGKNQEIVVNHNKKNEKEEEAEHGEMQTLLLIKNILENNLKDFMNGIVESVTKGLCKILALKLKSHDLKNILSLEPKDERLDINKILGLKPVEGEIEENVGLINPLICEYVKNVENGSVDLSETCNKINLFLKKSEEAYDSKQKYEECCARAYSQNESAVIAAKERLIEENKKIPELLESDAYKKTFGNSDRTEAAKERATLVEKALGPQGKTDVKRFSNDIKGFEKKLDALRFGKKCTKENVELLGLALSSLQEVRQNIEFLFQSPSLYEKMHGKKRLERTNELGKVTPEYKRVVRIGGTRTTCCDCAYEVGVHKNAINFKYVVNSQNPGQIDKFEDVIHDESGGSLQEVGEKGCSEYVITMTSSSGDAYNAWHLKEHARKKALGSVLDYPLMYNSNQDQDYNELYDTFNSMGLEEKMDLVKSMNEVFRKRSDMLTGTFEQDFNDIRIETLSPERIPVFKNQLFICKNTVVNNLEKNYMNLISNIVLQTISFPELSKIPFGEKFDNYEKQINICITNVNKTMDMEEKKNCFNQFVKYERSVINIFDVLIQKILK